MLPAALDCTCEDPTASSPPVVSVSTAHSSNSSIMACSTVLRVWWEGSNPNHRQHNSCYFKVCQPSAGSLALGETRDVLACNSWLRRAPSLCGLLDMILNRRHFNTPALLSHLHPVMPGVALDIHQLLALRKLNCRK